MLLLLLSCVIGAMFVWLIKTGMNEQNARDTLIKSYNIPKSQLVLFGTSSCLGFNLESKTAIFANWHTFFRHSYQDKDGNIRYGETGMCNFSDHEPIENIKEFCIYEVEDGLKDLKEMKVYFKNKPKYCGHEGAMEAWVPLPCKEIEKVTKLIESVGIKVSSNLTKTYSISWGD